MKKLSILLSVVCCLLLGSSCTTSSHYSYFQNIEEIDQQKFSDKYEAVIKKDDRLIIMVYGQDKEVVEPYNITYSMGNLNMGSNNNNNLYGYLVDKDGFISFPVLGDIHVEGMTRRQLEKYLVQRIGEDVKNPTVHVNFNNYTITFLGAINTNVRMESERISILKALAQAGFSDQMARRDNVLLVREVDGVATYHRLDLRKAELLSNEYYWLQQNDMIYIAPGPINDYTKTSALWLSVLSTISTITTMVLLLVK